MDADRLLQRLMFVSVMCVWPVGVNMTFFRVFVLVNMRFMDDSYVFVNMMAIFMIVQMRMNHLMMQVQM